MTDDRLHGDAAQRWQAPDLHAAFAAAAAPATGPSLANLDAIEQAAREEGFARGHVEGFAQGQGEARRLSAQIAGLLDAFSRPLAELDGDVQQALGELAVRIAGALLQRAYSIEPQLLADLVAQAVDTAGQGVRAVEVRMHPDDIAAVEPLLVPPPQTRLRPDATLARGDVRVHTDALRLDATIASRLQNALAQLNTQGAVA